MVRDRDDLGGSRGGWRHRVQPGWENATKCRGFRHVEIDGYSQVVRCEELHAHQLVDCYPPGSEIPTQHKATEFGDDDEGHRCPGGMVARLSTEAQARAKRAKERPPSNEDTPEASQKALMSAINDFRARECRDPKGLVQLGHIVPGVAAALSDLGGPLETPPAAPDCPRQGVTQQPPIPEQHRKENATQDNLVRLEGNERRLEQPAPEDDIPF